MRVVAAVTFAAMLVGCTSVKMVQRDGCWIKRTEKVFGRVREEIGPCTRPQPQWAGDQLTRLVQECVAQADYRWQGRALEAWSRSRSYPAQAPQEEILRTCMQEARVGLVNENDELKRRVADLSAERETLRGSAEQERSHLRDSNDRIAKYLGEAAQRPAGTATATASATSDGKATNESGATLASESSSGSAATPPPVTAALPVQPTAGPASPASRPPAPPARTVKTARARRAPAAPPQQACTPGCDAAASGGTPRPAAGEEPGAKEPHP